MARDADHQPAAASPAADRAEGAAEGLHHVLEAAQRFLACRERASALAPWSEARPARTLAEAIERDFVGFDLERAEAELRAAVAALCGAPPLGSAHLPAGPGARHTASS